MGRICPESQRSERQSGLEPGLAGPRRRHCVLPALCGVVATVFCSGLPGIGPMCKGHLAFGRQKGLSSRETENQVVISFARALVSLGGPRIPVLAAGSGETPPKALGSRKGDSFYTPPTPQCW